MLLGPARRDPAKTQARIARRRQAFSRRATGAAVLLGYYFWHKLAIGVSSSVLMQEAAAFAIGLFAVSLWASARLNCKYFIQADVAPARGSTQGVRPHS